VKQLRKRLTYANVMSSIAVFLVLGGGTAFALAKNSIGTRELKRNSVKRGILARNSVYPGKINLEAVKAGRIAKNAIARDRLRNGIVSTDKLQDLAVTEGKLGNFAVTNPKLANNSVTADKADGSIQKTGDLLFATVAPATAAATIVRGRGAVSVIRQKAGSYRVVFNRDITGCTWLATYGQPNNSFVDARWATVRGRDVPTQIGVVLRDQNGAEVDGVGFHVAAFCP
jgi:hypothetical protein